MIRFIKRLIFAWRCKVDHFDFDNRFEVKKRETESGIEYYITEYACAALLIPKGYCHNGKPLKGFRIWFSTERHGICTQLWKQRMRLARRYYP